MSNNHTPERDTSIDAQIALDRVRSETSRLLFEPKGTVRCDGVPMFRTRAARDAACLADVDPTVDHWSCLPLALTCGGSLHVPDLAFVGRGGDMVLVDVVEDASRVPDWIPEAAGREGCGHRTLETGGMGNGYRLENARELLRYARWRVSLNDRVRLVAALDENGPLAVRACMDVLGTRDAIAAIAALTLRRFIDVDLDEAPIGPDSRVRLAHRT